MTAPGGAADFFAIEAGEYLDRLDAIVDAASNRPLDVDAFARSSRALRGAATMARQTPLAELAAAIEGVAAAVRADAGVWRPRLSDAVVSAIDGYRVLLRAIRAWDDVATGRAAGHATELLSAVASPDGPPSRSGGIIPIARLFHDDEGPHVVHRNPQPAITADLRFRQAAVPLASTLRRLIAEARRAVDDGARRSVGEDLRAALRDLGELAESYDIAPVVNFARAREAALGRLDERALEIVDGAAQALVESAGTAWARPTPPSGVTAIEPPAPVVEAPAVVEVAPPPPPPVLTLEPPAPRIEPAPGPAAPSSWEPPPSGQALVALLETSISGLHRLRTEGVEDVAPVAAPAATPNGARISIRALEYRGRAALDRAREVRDLLRAAPHPDPELLAELYDLLDLAADEPAHA